MCESPNKRMELSNSWLETRSRELFLLPSPHGVCLARTESSRNRKINDVFFSSAVNNKLMHKASMLIQSNKPKHNYLRSFWNYLRKMRYNPKMSSTKSFITLETQCSQHTALQKLIVKMTVKSFNHYFKRSFRNWILFHIAPTTQRMYRKSSWEKGEWKISIHPWCTYMYISSIPVSHGI